MYNLYFHSAVSAMKVILVSNKAWRHRRTFQSDVYKRRRYRAEDCIEMVLYEEVTGGWPDTLLIWPEWR